MAASRAGALVLVLAVIAACSGNDDGSAPAQDPASLAADAFVWGYPLVVTQRTLQTLGALVGVNQLLNQAQLSNASTRVIVAPNQDTLYSVAVLDLRSEPMVLTVPDVTDRYFTYQFLDAWTNSFHYIGSRATSGRGGTFWITPPGWDGVVPAGVERIASPTPQSFLLGRFLVRDEADLANVTALQRTLSPLHVFTGSEAPEPPPSLGTAPGSPQLAGTDGAAFFDELGDALAVNPPASEFDKGELARFAALGIGPGLHPAAEARDELEQGATEGMVKIDAAIGGSALGVNGWTVRMDIGTYGSNTLLRAAIAKAAWGANVPEEAVYPVSAGDASGQRYSGTNRYVMRFPAGGLPPVDPSHGFWSLTLYGPDRFFVENSIRRYAIGDRTPGLVYNADGSLDLYIQNEAPLGREGNWLPAPASEFLLMLRLYLPGASVLNGEYRYPAVVPN